MIGEKGAGGYGGGEPVAASHSDLEAAGIPVDGTTIRKPGEDVPASDVIEPGITLPGGEPSGDEVGVIDLSSIHEKPTSLGMD